MNSHIKVPPVAITPPIAPIDRLRVSIQPYSLVVLYAATHNFAFRSYIALYNILY